MRVSDKKLNPSLKKQIRETFEQALVDLKDRNELSIFLNDFFTDSELEAFSKRLAIAYWLKKGRSYSNIKENLKVSSATIASVQNQMDNKGLKLALEKIEAEEWASQWAKKIKNFIK
jgi:TrpR-related protein YerC/YecD